MIGNNLAGTLVPQAYDATFTNWLRRFNDTGLSGTAERTGPMRSAPVPFALIGNAPPIIIAPQDPNRKGLMIKNLDPVELLYVGFGTLADLNGFTIEPRQTMLLDFVCPTDAISVFATANVRGYFVAFAPIA